MATGYGMDGPGIESWWKRNFPHKSRLALGPSQPPVRWVPDLFRGVESGRDVTLTLTPSSAEVQKQSRAMPLLSLRAFVACKKCETYLHLLVKNNRRNNLKTNALCWTSIKLTADPSNSHVFVLGIRPGKRHAFERKSVHVLLVIGPEDTKFDLNIFAFCATDWRPKRSHLHGCIFYGILFRIGWYEGLTLRRLYFQHWPGWLTTSLLLRVMCGPAAMYSRDERNKRVTWGKHQGLN
jgi:hypothetical protein